MNGCAFLPQELSDGKGIGVGQGLLEYLEFSFTEDQEDDAVAAGQCGER